MRRSYIVLAVVFLLCLIIPFLVSGFWVRTITHIFMFASLASALNIIAGFTGYAAFGNVVYFGTGAYATAVFMNRLQWGFVPSLIGTMVVVLILSVLLGLLLLRLKGHYFALGTVGAMEAMRYTVENMTDLTGGAQGITIPSIVGTPFFLNAVFYFMMFALMIGAIILAWSLSKSRLGYGFKAIRANEEAAGVMGINTTLYKIIAWSLSALITGVAGGIYAYWFSYIDPPTVFNVMWVVEMFAIILIGGVGTVFGPIIGAVILETISEVVWAQFIDLHLGILGVLIILIVLFIPEGLISIVKSGMGFKSILKNFRNRRVSA